MKWMRHYGGTDLDWGGSIVQTDDGGYIVAGTTHSFGLQSFTAWAFKIDANGNKLWHEIFVGGHVAKIIRTNDGNYVISGDIGGKAWILKFEDFENNPPTMPTQYYDKNTLNLKLSSTDPDGGRLGHLDRKS